MNKKIYFLLVGVIIDPFNLISLQAKSMKKKMNVLFVMADDLRPELGCYGVKDIHTPHIDHFASYSMVFDNAYCNAPVSGASRGSL